MLSAPLPHNESQRLLELRELGVLDSSPEESYDALARSAALITGCPMAVVTLVDEHRQWFKAVHGLTVRETPRAIAFCAHAILGEQLFEVPDALADLRFHDNPLVTAAPSVRFYAGVPLRFAGVMLGTLAVFDHRPRELDPGQRTALEGLALAVTELLRSRRRLVALHEERMRLHDLARASGDWMWETDDALRYRWISGQFEPITGLSTAMLLGRRVEDAPVLDAQGEVHAGAPGLLARLEGREPLSRVVTVKDTPRGRLFVSRSALPVFDEHGQFRGWRGTARDVTAQIIAQRLAAQRDELLRKLSSQIPGMMFQYVRHADGSSSFPYVSDGVLALFGVSGEQLRADPMRAFRVVHPDDIDAVRDGIELSASTLTLWHAEYRVVLSDGRTRWLEMRAMPERLDDGSTRWHAFTADVTQRREIRDALRQGQERWQMAAAAAGIGIAEVDLATGRLDFDERACANHGLDWPRPGYTLAEWMASLHPDDRAEAEATLRRTIERHGAFEARYRIVRPGGALATLEFTGQVTTDAQGRAVSLVGTCRDITQQVALDQLRRDKEGAERANRAKSEFLSRMSHELRTPLNSIIGFAQLMELDRQNPLALAQQRRLDGVQRAGRHLLGLINDVLDLSRIEQGEQRLALEPVDAAEAVAGCLEMIRPLARDAEVELAEFDAPPPLWVMADRRALEQVLMNLLSNAIKYNRAGGRVEVALGLQGSVVRIAVSDEGPGFSDSQQSRLFQHFDRLGAENGPIEGTGLGLVISRALVFGMHGQLELRSRPGEGSTFSVLLGAAQAPPRPAAPSDAGSPPRTEDPHAPKRCVLYIEDEPLNVLLMEEVFRARPEWSLTIAETGTQGLRLARERQPDLLLIDMNLPDMSGLDLIRTLRGDLSTRHLRCIALSADAMQAQIDAALANGMDAYWTKPIDVPRVLSDLAALLG